MRLALQGLGELQTAQSVWVAHNFPNENPHSPLLGLTEEVGELAHAHLKREQKIRGTEAEHQAAAADAIGDIVIYLASYCNRNGYDLAACVRRAWDEVSERDWIKYPRTGKPNLVQTFSSSDEMPVVPSERPVTRMCKDEVDGIIHDIHEAHRHQLAVIAADFEDERRVLNDRIEGLAAETRHWMAMKDVAFRKLNQIEEFINGEEEC